MEKNSMVQDLGSTTPSTPAGVPLSGNHLENVLISKHPEAMVFSDKNNKAFNIIFFGNNDIPKNFIAVADQCVRPTKYSFLGRTVIPNLVNAPKMDKNSKFVTVMKKNVSTRSVLFDLYPLYMQFVTSFVSYSKIKIKEAFESILIGIIKDFNQKSSNRKTVLILDETFTLNTYDLRSVKISSVIEFFRYLVMFHQTLEVPGLDAVLFYNSINGKFYPLTFAKKTYSTDGKADGESNSVNEPLVFNKQLIYKAIKDIQPDITEDSLNSDQQTTKIEQTTANLVEDKQAISNILTQLDSIDKNGVQQEVGSKATKSSKPVQVTITQAKEKLLQQIKDISNKYPGSTLQEKLHYIFSDKTATGTNAGATDNKVLVSTPDKKVTPNQVEKINLNLEEVNRIYNGSISFSDIEKHLVQQVFQPKDSVGLSEFSSMNKQSTEMFEKLDENVRDLTSAFSQDPDLKIEVKGITNKLVETNRDRFIEYNVKIQHDYGITTKKPYTITFRVPAPIDDKYLKIGGNSYIMIQQLFPQPIQKVSNTMARLYTHYNVTSVFLKGSRLDSKDFKNIEKEFFDSLLSNKMINRSDLVPLDIKAKELLLDYNCPLTVSELQYNVTKPFKIDFLNEVMVSAGGASGEDGEKERRLMFYTHETGAGGAGTDKEFAYITKTNDDIVYYNNGDYNTFPKSKINEFLINLYNNYSKKTFGDKFDILKKSKSSQPQFMIKISGNNIPVVVYNILNRGWEESFKFLGISYNFSDKKANTPDGNNYSIKFKNGYVNMFPHSLYEIYMVNGILSKKNQLREVDFDAKSITLLDDIYNELIGEYKLQALKLSRYKIIDSTSAKLLKELGYSDDIFTIYSKIMPNLIMDREQIANLDINNFRLRMSEVVSHFMYNQIQQSVAYFKKRAHGNSNAKIDINKDFIISNLQSAGIMQYTKSMNPLEELLISTKVTKTGVGNTKKSQVTLERRDLNDSYFGTISPTTTNEYSGIGSNQTLTLGSKIKDKFGNIVTQPFGNNNNSFENLSVSEALNPFMEYNDTTRAIMGNQQTSQFVELENADEPLVQTGFEAIVPHLLSSRFAKKAKKDGKVVKITDSPTKTIQLQYKDGTKETIDIGMLKTRTKRGIFIPSEYVVQVGVGQSVNKGQILASTNSIKSGKLAIGKNLVVAELPYLGMNYEDGWVATNILKEKYKSSILTKMVIQIPSNCKIQKFNLGAFVTKHSLPTETGDLLIEYQKDNFRAEGIDDGDDFDSDNGDDVLTGLVQKGKTIKYFSPGGEIKDIVIKINDKVGLPKEVTNLHNILSTPLQYRLDSCKKSSGEVNEQVRCLGHIENLDMLTIGGHKINNIEYTGAIIELYILTENPVRNGSKFILSNSGGKGTIQYMIPEGKEPVAMSSHLKIDFIGTPLSIIGRKSPNIIFNMYLGKVMYFLNLKAKDLVGAGATGAGVGAAKTIKDLEKMVTEVYKILDNTNDHFIIKNIETFFKQDPNQIIKMLKNSDPLNKPLFPAIVPPFKNHLDISNIEQAAKLLGVQLNEKVYIPENGSVTETEVVVGILPVFMLEHFPKAMSSTRGAINVKDQFISGQGISGSQEGKGAIKVGLYDMYAILSKNGGGNKQQGNLIKELHSLKSDAVASKRKYINSLLYKNELPNVNITDPVEEVDTKTKNWISAMFYGCGLEPDF